MLKFRFITTVVLLILFSFSSSKVMAEGVENARIMGVADFLVERANANYMYIVESKLKKSIILQEFFPNIYRQLTFSGLTHLFLIPEKVWKDTIEKDIEFLGDKISKSIDTKIINPAIEEITNFIQRDIYSKLEISIDGKKWWSLGLDDPPDEFMNQPAYAAVHNILYAPLAQLVDFNIRKQIGLHNQTVDLKNLKTIREFLHEISGLLKQDVNNMGAVLKNINISVGKQALKSELMDIQFRVIKDESSLESKQMSKLLKEGTNVLNKFFGLVDIYDLINEIKSADTYTERMQYALLVLEKAIKFDLQVFKPKDSKQKNRDLANKIMVELDNYKKYLLLFAQMADATTREEVKQALKAITMPDVSFASARAPGFHIFISGYLGVAYGYGPLNITDASKRTNSGFLFAPVGIELVWGLAGKCGRGSSLGILLSPFDFGNPVNTVIFDDNKTFTYTDIISPGVYLQWGLKDIPLAIQLGLNRRPVTGTDVKNHYENRLIIAVTMDMPLFQLY
ncbi:MAG: hypothetical protein ABUK01_14595 [Leptospirales bacterium]